MINAPPPDGHVVVEAQVRDYGGNYASVVNSQGGELSSDYKEYMYQESEKYIYNEMIFNQTTPRFNKIQDLVTKFEAHFGKGENAQGRALQFTALGLWVGLGSQAQAQE
ncbi:hypothetical protein ACNPQM_36920 [Streptomyces sp. NPDC056231]|uniref:hypothetical protein n=1 Tax=Streptomyces sp. NPDC056231 TaxID=3345755 RepID=UPI003AAAB460